MSNGEPVAYRLQYVYPDGGVYYSYVSKHVLGSCSNIHLNEVLPLYESKKNPLVKKFLSDVWNPNNTDSVRVKLEKAISLLESL